MIGLIHRSTLVTACNFVHDCSAFGYYFNGYKETELQECDTGHDKSLSVELAADYAEQLSLEMAESRKILYSSALSSVLCPHQHHRYYNVTCNIIGLLYGPFYIQEEVNSMTTG